MQDNGPNKSRGFPQIRFWTFVLCVAAAFAAGYVAGSSSIEASAGIVDAEHAAIPQSNADDEVPPVVGASPDTSSGENAGP